MMVLKTLKALFKRISVSHQTSGNLTACKRPKTQGQPRFFKNP
ncbi:hypothetical protein ACQJ71_02170 [Helicobacter pylori]